MAPLKLYNFVDSPPALAVRLCLEALQLPHQLIDMDYFSSEHLAADFEKKNPQKEIPLLDDDGFLLSESAAILQYLGDKYDTGKLYPKDVNQRAIVNHRLAFNISSYYPRILDDSLLPLIFGNQQSEAARKKLLEGLSVFNTILQRQGTKYSAGDSLTIADFSLIAATMCLESVNFDLNDYPKIKEWYTTFKTENPKLWATVEKTIRALSLFLEKASDFFGKQK